MPHVVPARAGMSPTGRGVMWLWASGPRASGDEPQEALLCEASFGWSPRERG